VQTNASHKKNPGIAQAVKPAWIKHFLALIFMGLCSTGY
jgi:hypothetical protein